MTYKVEFSAPADRQLSRLPLRLQARLVRRVDRLAEEPRPTECRKLAGRTNRYRIRVGDYRVIYEVRDDVLLVLVLRLGHRREVYRRGP